MSDAIRAYLVEHWEDKKECVVAFAVGGVYPDPKARAEFCAQRYGATVTPLVAATGAPAPEAFRVNMLRLLPNLSHADIDLLIQQARAAQAPLPEGRVYEMVRELERARDLDDNETRSVRLQLAIDDLISHVVWDAAAPPPVPAQEVVLTPVAAWPEPEPAQAGVMPREHLLKICLTAYQHGYNDAGEPVHRPGIANMNRVLDEALALLAPPQQRDLTTGAMAAATDGECADLIRNEQRAPEQPTGERK